MCLSPRQVARKDVYGSWHVVTVDCGKCWECVRKRQNEMAALVVRESEFRGALMHVTFSYAPEHLPMYYVHRFYDADSLEYAGCSKPVRISKSTELFTCQYADILLSKSDKLFLRQVRAPRRKKLRSIIIQLQSVTKTEQERADILKHSRNTLKLREDFIRRDYIRQFGRHECRRGLLVDSRLSDDGRFVVDTEVRPSLCRNDISLYLKRERVRYEREFGRKLPKFTYNVIGEMGPKHGRPHFHMCVCAKPEDLPILENHLFCHQRENANFENSWHNLYGNVKCKRVVRYDFKKGSGHDGFEAAGKYIGKYLAKGQEFEEENVVRGFVERPRRCCSANFGVGNLDALRRFHLCWDLFGKYDVRSPATYPSDTSALVDWVLSRMFLTINSHKYPIPRRIKQLLFHENRVQLDRTPTPCPCTSLSTFVDSNESAAWSVYYDQIRIPRKVVKRSSALSRLVSSRVQENALRDYTEKLRSFVGKPLEKTTYSDRLAFEDSLRLVARERSNSIAASQHKFLQRSAF